ncbi:sensor histidine kinase [Pseudochryseolinea flava]|uniref:sensor histidine kinase n=1 Tax=Pseudochryseolinea flava TaxID=2059302 RepID=UPI001FE46BA8|nr:HAMP domain-containing sensor histidine kinase [Pseudochryseolinea flava]
MKSSIALIVSVVLFAAGCALLYWTKTNDDPQIIATKLSERLQQEIQLVDDDVKRIEGKVSSGKYVDECQYPYYIYQFQSLKYWSDHTFVPSYPAVADSFKLKLLKYGNSEYVAVKHELKNGYTLVAIIPLYRKYSITNDYLQTTWNEKIFPSRSFVIHEANASQGEPIIVDKQVVFRVSFVNGEFTFGHALSWIGVALILASLCYAVYRLMRFFSALRYADVGFVALFLTLRLLRHVMITFNFPNDYLHSDLFNPGEFASSNLNGSLGDLWLNELALLVLCLFIFQHYPKLFLLRVQRRSALLNWTISVFYALAVLFAFMFPFIVIQTLANNSSIVLDVSHSLSFDTPRVAALGAVLLAGICSFLFAHAFIRLLIGDKKRTRIMISFFIAVIFFVGINEWTGQRYISSVILGTIYIGVVYVAGFSSSLMRLRFSTFGYLFACIFFFSVNGAYAIYHYSWQQKIDDQFRFANEFLIDRDIFGEYLLQETAAKISRDVFIQTRVASPFLNRDAIRQKIRQVFLPGYFNKYDVEIFLFNSSGGSLDEGVSITFAELIRNNKAATQTGYGDVYYLNSIDGTVAQQYVVAVPVKRSSSIAGYVVLTLGLKRVIPQNVYPELLVDNRAQQVFREQDLSYVVFSREGILYSAGDFNYEQFDREWLGSIDIHTQGFNAAGYDHIAEEDDNGRVAVVSSPETTKTYALGIFSFLMVLGLMLVLVFILIQGLVNYFRGDKLYFSARVQLYLNLAFFLPLIVVSISTLSLTNRFSQNQLNQEYLDKARAFGDQLSVTLSEVLESDDVNIPTFNSSVGDLAKLTNMDANVYDKFGVLMATSQPLIFENNLLSDYINQSALQKVRIGDNAFIRTEQAGKLMYYVAYAALKKPSSGELIGIVGIPFFRSAFSLEKVQIGIFVNILNTFCLIFIALVILSYFVSQWLTFPLKFITQSLRRTSLTKTNQPLVWKADDEIGLMVREYNQMLFSLSESKAELEQTQRERAWREIAQQVAHEIKNPLTPMKLTLQQLERALQSGKSSEEKTQKAVSSLLTQVDTLNEIASSFSSFAKMPEPVIQKLEITSLIKRIVDLHSPTGDLSVRLPHRELYVMGDEQLLGRTFSNIILNAFQAAIPGRSNPVVVDVDVANKQCVVSIADRGKGIEPAIAERIFIPYFTTKKSGSGLGLAIAKQGIEQMKGKLWFETKPGLGTAFFIELPLIES